MSMFHIVFVRTMQKTYFKISKKEFVRGKNIKNKIILRYDQAKHKFVSIVGLDEIKGSAADGIIFFLPLPK